jgi:NhaA family Na+:H+ antiporter
MATDIAFTLGVLSALGPRVPTGLRVFVTALAITDDLGSVLVIALFYSGPISPGMLFLAVALLALIALAVRLRTGNELIYAALVVGVWAAVLASGIHATVAGILIAMVVPVRGRIPPRRFFDAARRQIQRLEESGLRVEGGRRLSSRQMGTVEKLYGAISDLVPAGLALERYLHPFTAYLILPLFALFNAGIAMRGRVDEALANPVGLGVLLGLVVGKPVGILAATWVVVRMRFAELPANVTWRHMVGAAILAGFGFTMSLFICDLAIEDPELIEAAKIGILSGSAVCAALGYAVLRGRGRRTV